MHLRAPFRLQYASNLFAFKTPRPAAAALKRRAAPNLALLGNCVSVATPAARAASKEFLQFCSAGWDRTLLVVGPYEFASEQPMSFVDVRESLRELANECKGRGSIELLDQTEVHFPREGVRVLGTAGWAPVQAPPSVAARSTLVELDQIWQPADGALKPLQPEDIHELHREDMDWLKDAVGANPQPAVVLTHSLPSYLLIATGLPPEGLWRAPFDYLGKRAGAAMSPTVPAWLGGASGGTVSGTMCPWKMFMAVNSWKSFPEQQTPNPNFQADAVLTLSPQVRWPLATAATEAVQNVWARTPRLLPRPQPQPQLAFY